MNAELFRDALLILERDISDKPGAGEGAACSDGSGPRRSLVSHLPNSFASANLLSSNMRRAARRDANHSSIKDVFESLDCSVLDIASAPCGFDLVIGYKTQAILVEVKNPEVDSTHQKLTQNEFSAHLNWRGPKAIVKTTEEAVLVAKLLRARHFSVVADAIADGMSA